MNDPLEVARKMDETYRVSGDKWFNRAAETIRGQDNEIRRLRAIIAAAHHTLSQRGKIDANTPLHKHHLTRDLADWRAR